MKKTVMLGVALIALSACASGEPAPSPPPPTASRPAPPPSEPSEPDHCGLAEARKFVGRPRTEIPVPVKPDLQRVACTTCPVTMDFKEKRLNFFYDAATGIVKEVRCG